MLCMTVTESIITIAIVAGATMLTRFLPFFIFPEGRQAPAYIRYLGTVLPFAVIGLLVVYCLKDAVFADTHALPELLALGFILVLHFIKHNALITILGGTIFYMVLVQNFFTA